MTNEQNAAQTNDQPKADTEDKGAQDLDSLLKEFDDDKEEPKKSPDEKTSEEKPKESDEDKSFIQQLRKERVEKELSDVVKNVKGDLKFSDKLVRGYLEAEAAQNPAVAKAYVNRHKNPDAWAKIEKQFNRDLKSMQDSLSDKSQESKKRVMDAVRSSQTQSQTDAPDWSKLNDREFEKAKNEYFSQFG